MISLIEALNYRCLKYIPRPLNSFHVLVGPNASGKTTFLDVIAFLGKFVSDGLDASVLERTQSFADLTWNHSEPGFELAIEASIPEEMRDNLSKPFDLIRYEISLGFDYDSNEFIINDEKVLLKKTEPTWENMAALLDVESFPRVIHPPNTIITAKPTRGKSRVIVNKTSAGNDNFYSEVEELGSGWAPSYKLGRRKSALGNLPEDEFKFPVSTWLKRLLSEGVQTVVLNSLLIRKASPPGQANTFKPDGSNLPWVIETLSKESKDRFGRWISHVQTALPDIEGIRTIVRDDDRHRYLMIRYRGGLEVPSWLVSDGTLRLLALTLPAYLTDFKGIYLIEEPENGIHPRAIETVFQSLSSVYNAQILLATHSPVILGVAEAKDVLCFAKNDEGATDIVSGDKHPSLKDWKGQLDLGDLFASGVLG